MLIWAYITACLLSARAEGGLSLADAARMPVLGVESAVFSRAEVSDLSRALGLSVGAPVDPRKLNEGVRAIQSKGRIQGLFVDARRDGKGVRITLSGTRTRRLRKLTFRGVDAEVLVGAQRGLNLQEGETADIRAFTELRDRIKEAYAERGYPFADVNVVVNDLAESDEADVEVAVDPREATKVRALRVTGGTTEDNDSLAALMGIRRGDVYSKRRIDEGVERINQYLRANGYPTSKVEQVLNDFTPDKLAVEIRVLLKLEDRFLLTFQGNTVFGDVQLKAFLTEEVLSQIDATTRIVELVENKYREVGYHFVKVTVSDRLEKAQRLRLVTFQVDEGPKVLIDRVHINGGETYGQSALRSRFLRDAPGVLARKVYWEKGIPNAVENLKRRLVEEGYLSAVVGTPRVAFSNDREGAEIFLDVEPGGRTIVTALELKGVFHFSRSRVEGALGVEVGEPINRAEIEQGQARILDMYQEAGFVDAKFADGDPVELSSNRRDATVRITIHEGIQYFVGDISVVGNEKTGSDVILREMKLATGDTFNPKLVRASEESIATLSLFSRAEMLATNNPSQSNRKDLKILVKENRPGTGEVGFGGEFEDPTLRLRSFFGLTYRNLFGRNQTLSFRSELALPFTAERFIPFVEYAAILGYRVPYPLGIPITFSSQVGLDGFQINPVGPVIQRRARIDSRIEKRISNRLTVFYRLHHFERTSTEQLDSEETDYDLAVENIGSTGPGAILDLRNDPFNPTTGSYHTIDVELAHPALLSEDDIAFLMAISRNTFFIPLIKPFQFAAFLGVGYARSLFGGKPLPKARLEYELALGGQQSIRGFDSRIFHAEKNVTQTAYANARFEVSLPLFQSIGAAVFFDSGQIFPNLTIARRHDGVGFGIRYKTPVGPLLIDIARGLGADSDKSLRFYFTVGTF